MSCRSEAIARIREGVESLAKLADLAEGADKADKHAECSGYLFQICTVGTALADFAGLRAEATDGEG
ncbi:hypothetical protein ABIA31_004215 [Catenulispora sp. MAP5-51]|uniref:hypothetical protein n=1 Tax=Catenulispora sp. MAP5-51 TaxID=3156298 RepID=UPI00351107DC